MTEISAEGHTSTTTTVIDGKNGSVPRTSGKMLKRSVTEDIVTTFSSPAAWLLVIALIITWSAVAVVMFDLVDYKNFSASSISKIGSDPLKIVHDAVEETTDWIYGFFSLLSDIISSDEDDDDDEGVDTDEGEEEEPPLKKHEIHKEKAEKQEKPEKKIAPKVTHKEKPEKEKPEKKASHKDKPEKKEKPEMKSLLKDEKKSKSSKAEEKSKKEVKSGKPEKVKQADAKAKKVEKTPAKPKGKEEKGTAAVSKNEQKDQFAFCRYMIDMFAQGDLKPGTPNQFLHFSVLIIFISKVFCCSVD
ncbi:triadin [Phascolarctos cinereus]